MPNKNLYIKKKYLPLWEEAERFAETQDVSLSQYITLLLKQDLSKRNNASVAQMVDATDF